MIVEAIRKAVDHVNLSSDESAQVMKEIMNGQATDSQIAALITAMRMKGETAEEIFGFARVMREHAERISCRETCLLDTCGTGGDGLYTFNISTTAAFVAAGAGAKVAKHGNRSVSSKSGSADVLEALGVRIDLAPAQVEACIEEVGIGFLFAPMLHKAMKHAIGPRREIAIRTVFNILGPLTNPAYATAQILGVYDPALTETMAEVLGRLGVKHALVVHGADGLDELSTTGDNKVSEMKDGNVNTFTLSPGEVGIPSANIDELRGGSASENAEILKAILSGEQGPKRDIVVLNAAAALAAYDLAPDIRGAVSLAEKSIDEGAAMGKLKSLVEFSQSLIQG
jgi:anthranilate phosphoribosyltransferase